MDNAETQDTEDLAKATDIRFQKFVETAENSGGNVVDGFDHITASNLYGAGGMKLAGTYQGSIEFVGPESVMFGEDAGEGRIQRLFNKYVRPWLSEKEMNLIYQYYGMGMSAKDIAAATFKKNGKPYTEPGITKQIRKVREKVQTLIASHIDEE